MRQLLVLGLILIISFNFWAQEEKSDTVGIGGLNWFAYPYMFYSPETNLAFGAGGIISISFSENLNSKPSSLTGSGYYTINNQYDFTAISELYFFDDKYKLWAKFNYGSIFDYFYGIGNKTIEIENDYYLQNNILLQVKFQPKLFDDRFNFGLVYEYRKLSIGDKKDNPFLEDKNIQGINGGKTVGLGFVASWDSRDNIFYPHTGGYYELSATYFQQKYGSDFTYNKYIIDLRRFFKGFNNHVLGFQAYLMHLDSDPPFYDLALLGGDRVMRGYLYGRYRDKNYYTFQTEYRIPVIVWRFGLVLFGGFGDVASSFSKFEISSVKPTYGFGVRFRFDELQKLDLRVDIGFGKETNGIYFSVNQAF